MRVYLYLQPYLYDCSCVYKSMDYCHCNPVCVGECMPIIYPITHTVPSELS